MTSQQWLLVSGVAVVAIALSPLWRQQPVDYNTEVKPLLNKHCLACHGGVKRASDFSLLFREEALRPAKSGRAAIVPGDAGASEFIRRLSLHDPEERMPYKAPPLTAKEIDVLTRWVNEGARWGCLLYTSPSPRD